MIRAIVLDFDGLILDTETALIAAYGDVHAVHGRPFDPGTVPDVDLQEHVRHGRKGGLGIFLIRRIMDEVTYSFQAGAPNELRLVKFVDNSQGKAKSTKPRRPAKRSP